MALVLQCMLVLEYLFSFIDTATTLPYTLSLHDALPIYAIAAHRTVAAPAWPKAPNWSASAPRSEEHTSELQSRFDLVCRLLLEKKKNRTVKAMQPAL